MRKRDHTNQIEKYAQAVANDPQFRDTNTEWTFILVGNDYNDVVRRKITQRGRAKGILIEPGDQENVKYTVWVKTWSQILEDCRWRMKFFHDRFEYVPEEDDAIEYLRATHDKLLPKVFARPETTDDQPDIVIPPPDDAPETTVAALSS